MLDTALRVCHVLAAATALALGFAAMSVAKRPGVHPRFGDAYFIAVIVTCLSAAALAVTHWAQSWFFLPVALFTATFALIGYVAAKTRWDGWLVWHVGGLCSSYGGLVIAFIVNNWKYVANSVGIHSPIAFLLPGSVGTISVLWIMREVHAGRRPRLSTQPIVHPSGVPLPNEEL